MSIDKEKVEKDLIQWLKFEDELTLFLEKQWKKIQKLSDYSDMDLVYYSEKWKVWYIEAKERNYLRSDFIDTKIPIRKYIKALENLKDWLETFLFIKWKDRVWFIDMTKILPIKIQEEVSRWDRWINEKHIYVYYKVSDFTLINIKIIIIVLYN